MDKGVDQKRVVSDGRLFRRLIRRQMAEDASLNADKASLSSKGGIFETSQEDMVCNKAIDEDISVNPEEYVRDTSALLSLQPWIFKKERIEKNGEMGDKSGCTANALPPEPSPRSIGLGYKQCRNTSSLRSRQSQRYGLKPLTSIEDCLIPQLYQEHLEVEEYLFTSMSSSPASSSRPFIVTDGDRVISKSGYDSSSLQPGNGLLKNADEVSYGVLSEDGLHKDNHGGISLGMGRTVVGVPPLLESRRQKRKSREMQLEKLGIAGSQKSHRLSHSQGSFDGVLFCLGISIGIAFAMLSNKTEIEGLNSLLEHTKDLVQDLQEELDMKDSLTVKELSKERCQSQEVNCYSEIEESVHSFQNQYPAFHLAPQERDDGCPHFPVSAGNSESLSKIEAELEAELEILERNMKACNLQRRKSDLSELDPDLIGDVIHGELGADIPDSTSQKGQTDATSSSTLTPQARANHPVSPKELRLRLHEVIQFRLEEQIKELETALEQSQRQLQILETGVCSRRTFSNSDIGSSSALGSPTLIELDGALVHPLCLNLSGDALGAYDEAYEEFMCIAEEDEDDNLPSSTSRVEQIDQDRLCRPDQSLICDHESGEAKKLLEFNNYFKKEPAQEQILKRIGSSHTVGSDGEDSDDFFDEEEEMLIQQIVEKKRQGSSVLLNAQRMFFYLND
uniref:Uncharacterized protein LOC105056094 n=1 Tax=Elaeis guineensis var. tenera TaxID=51953 RepID=A0A6I9S3A6_ELAGV|nr:uncharacterized protein LOC105056094 [Elaeis guineensis]